MKELQIGHTTEVPREIKKWNWGAFMYNIFWGIGHNTYLPLLCLVPGLNIIWIFVCGAKGNEWAWKKGNYTSVDEFVRLQKTWNKAGLVYLIFVIAGVALYFSTAVMMFISVLGF